MLDARAELQAGAHKLHELTDEAEEEDDDTVAHLFQAKARRALRRAARDVQAVLRLKAAAKGASAAAIAKLAFQNEKQMSDEMAVATRLAAAEMM